MYCNYSRVRKKDNAISANVFKDEFESIITCKRKEGETYAKMAVEGNKRTKPVSGGSILTTQRKVPSGDHVAFLAYF